MFQRDCAQPAPKILISSVSEDRGTMPRPFRKAAARSWSSEDFLADSSHKEDNSISRAEEPKESASEVNSTSNSPQLSYTYSPTAALTLESGNNESLIADSAINSPDSWVESDFGVMPEKFHESQSDSSLCDSGTLDVYHATPVEITTIDEGFVPSIEDGVPYEESTAERFIDEGIYSLSSLESMQEKFKGHVVKKQPGEEREREDSFENPNQVMGFQNLPVHNEAEIAKEVHSQHRDTSLLQKGEEQELSGEIHDEEALTGSNVEDLLETEKTTQSQCICELPIPDHFEELVKNTSVECPSGEPEVLKKVVDYTGDTQAHEGQINGQSENQNERNISEVVEVETECQKTDPPAQETSQLSSQENEETVVDTQDETSTGVSRGCTDPQECSVTFDSLTNTYPMNLARDTEVTHKSLDPSTPINIPLISIFSEPGEQDRELTCDPDTQDQMGHDEVHQAEATGSKRSDTDLNCPLSPDELSCDTSDKNDKKHVEIPCSLVSEDAKHATSEQIRDIESVHWDDTDEHEISKSSNANVCLPETVDKKERSKDKQECESLRHSQTGDSERDLINQTSSTDTSSQPVETEQEIDLTDQKDGHEDKHGDNATIQQNTLNPVNLKHSETRGISHGEAGGICRESDLFYIDFDRNSSTDDLVGDPVEPMDLFYPDKEEPMFTEPPDTEIQSWPSVLSVSALQPAPTTEITLPDNQPCKMMIEDLRNGDDSIQDDSKVSMSLFRSASVMPFHFKMAFSF